MKSKRGPQNSKKPLPAIEPIVDASNSPQEDKGAFETATDPEEFNEFGETGPDGFDDEHWDVFVIDEDDRDALPDYGDFWFPD